MEKYRAVKRRRSHDPGSQLSSRTVHLIPEYWIVDYQRQQIWVLTDPDRLDGYDVVKHYPGETAESANFQGFSLTVDEILNPPFVEALMRQEQLRQDAMANRLRALGIDPDAC